MQDGILPEILLLLVFSDCMAVKVHNELVLPTILLMDTSKVERTEVVARSNKVVVKELLRIMLLEISFVSYLDLSYLTVFSKLA